jgi:biotin operon repressor
MQAIPMELDNAMHPLCNREIAIRILQTLESNPVVCIQDVARATGCSNLTAQKHLERIVRAGLAVEKRVGRVRIFISRDMRRDPI